MELNSYVCISDLEITGNDALMNDVFSAHERPIPPRNRADRPMLKKIFTFVAAWWWSHVCFRWMYFMGLS